MWRQMWSCSKITLQYTYTLSLSLSLSHTDSNLTLEEELLVRSTNTSRSLVLRNNSVYVNTAGLYYFYAQVTFGQVPQSGERMVSLISNANLPHWQERILSKAVGWGNKEGSISISRTISGRSGQSLRLEIKPRIPLRHNTELTYWGLFLLPPYWVRGKRDNGRIIEMLMMIMLVNRSKRDFFLN